MVTGLRAVRPGFDSRQSQVLSTFRHCTMTDSGAHPASYPMGTRGSFPGIKAPRTWSWLLTSILCRGQECVELYLHSPSTSSWRGSWL